MASDGAAAIGELASIILFVGFVQGVSMAIGRGLPAPADGGVVAARVLRASEGVHGAGVEVGDVP